MENIQKLRGKVIIFASSDNAPSSHDATFTVVSFLTIFVGMGSLFLAPKWPNYAKGCRTIAWPYRIERESEGRIMGNYFVFRLLYYKFWALSLLVAPLEAELSSTESWKEPRYVRRFSNYLFRVISERRVIENL